MVPQMSTLSVSSKFEGEEVESKEPQAPGAVPDMLQVAWSVCTPADKPLVDQLNPQEKSFLISFSEYVSTALTSPMAASDPKTVLSVILMTACHRLSRLFKEISVSPNHVVIATMLRLLSNLFSSDNMKYTTMGSFLEVYPSFQDRSVAEKDKLFYTANWMHVLFQIITAKMNKGMVMEIIPKFVEGNSANYVTGSGQTRNTKDRVIIYETEGNVKPVKRVPRILTDEETDIIRQKGGKRNSKSTKRKPTLTKRKSLTVKDTIVVTRSMSDDLAESPSSSMNIVDNRDFEDAIDMDHVDNEETEIEIETQSYLPLSFAMAPPIPVRRSQSSFSQAAAAIASFNQTEVDDDTNGRIDPESKHASSDYLCSPRECYLDVDVNGSIKKTTSGTWGLASSLSSSSLAAVSTMSPRSNSSQTSNPDYQLRMLREVSEDSDFSVDVKGTDSTSASAEDSSSHILPPYLMHQQSLTLALPPSCSTSSTLGSPSSQPRSFERCPSTSLQESGEVDFELLEVLSRQASYSWLARSGSSTSLSGRESAMSVVNEAPLQSH